MTKFLIAVPINLFGMLVIYSLMANAITRYYWRGRGTMSVLGTIIAAGLFWMLPTFYLLYQPGSTAHPLWLGNWLVSGFSIVILCQSVRWIPRELEDSARLDGAGWIGTYQHVVLPLVRRELGLIASLTLMATSIPAECTLPGSPVVPPWIHLMLPTGAEHDPGVIRILLTFAAGSVIMTLPLMAIFFLSKSWFLRPATLGNK